jgi:transcriptional regulator PpsR
VARPHPAKPDLHDVIERMPDGFVVVDGSQRILEANAAFLAMVELVSADRLKGAPLEDWLGRPGLDAALLLANLREHGALRDFATVVRGQFGAVEQVEVTGVSVSHGGAQRFGLMVRPARRRSALATTAAGPLFRSVEQLTELVGRVPLKDLVRETTDIVERLCIEAALRLTEDNRASAAQILGVSRQSLYSKLHRYGLLREGETIDAE